MRKVSIIAGISVLCAAGVGAPEARAEDVSEADAQVATLQEIVVTAQKRQENLQDVPVSIAVVSGEQLGSANVNNLYDLPRVLPGLSMYQGTDSKDVAPRI